MKNINFLFEKISFTLKALKTWSGAIVFLPSARQILFASAAKTAIYSTQKLSKRPLLREI